MALRLRSPALEGEARQGIGQGVKGEEINEPDRAVGWATVEGEGGSSHGKLLCGPPSPFSTSLPVPSL